MQFYFGEGSVYVVCVRSIKFEVEQSQTNLSMKNFKQEKIPWFTFNPEMALTGFRTTRPWEKWIPAEIHVAYL